MEHKIPHALAAKRSTITIILLILIKVGALVHVFEV